MKVATVAVLVVALAGVTLPIWPEALPAGHWGIDEFSAVQEDFLKTGDELAKVEPKAADEELFRVHVAVASGRTDARRSLLGYPVGSTKYRALFVGARHPGRGGYRVEDEPAP